MEAVQGRHGLNDLAFAKKLGLSYITYRALMGRDKKRKGSQGPTLRTIATIGKNLDVDDFYYLITGKTIDGRRSTGPGPETARYLEMAQNVLDSGTSTAEALKSNIVEFHRFVSGEKPGGESPTNPKEVNPAAGRGRKAAGGPNHAAPTQRHLKLIYCFEWGRHY